MRPQLLLVVLVLSLSACAGRSMSYDDTEMCDDSTAPGSGSSAGTGATPDPAAGGTTSTGGATSTGGSSSGTAGGSSSGGRRCEGSCSGCDPDSGVCYIECNGDDTCIQADLVCPEGFPCEVAAVRARAFKPTCGVPRDTAARSRAEGA